jgi:anti-sigma-K factor RskA
VSVPETRQALAALALGVLPAGEAREVEEGAAEDAELARELDEYRATVGTLERMLAREPGPVHLFEAGRKMPRAWHLRSVRRRDLAIAAVVAFIVAVLGILVLRGGGAEPDARAEIVPASGGGVRGEALLYDTGRDDGRLVLHLSGVPAPAEGHHYEVWVLRVGSKTLESVGAFTARGEFEDEFRLPGPGRYAAVDVSIEEDGGDQAHSGRSLGAGTFT